MAKNQYRHLLVTVALFLGAGLLPVAPIKAETTAAPIEDIDERWATCAPPQGSLYQAPPPSENAQPGETALSANEVLSQAGGVSRFSGDVVVQSDGRTLQGDLAQYDQSTGEVNIEGNIRFHAEELSMQGERATVRLEEESGEFEGVSFFFPQQHAYGSADSLQRRDRQHSVLKGVRYTTCNPEQQDWLLSASKLKLDQQSNTGEAYNTVFRFKGVPIFYSPYLNFPLAGRKSGLLPPTVGSSDSSGNDTRLPVYWNIAPNYDATITPRNLSRRGLMLMNEFRLLTPNTRGEVQFDYLYDDQLYGDDRKYLAVEHSARLGNNWSTSLSARHVTDTLYLDEIGVDGEAASSSHLERRFDLNYHSRHWDFLAYVQDYQAIVGTEPYQRLPQLSLRGHSSRHPNRLHYTLQSEAVTFAHDSAIPTGTRLDLKPGISLPLQGAAWYITPTAAWRHTDYTLENYPQGEHFTRSLPILSMDSGLYFDRETRLGGRAMTHTLEPRLFYLSVPYEDQSMLPRFDTGYSDPGFSQLFSDNRFNGPDRQGDAEQLTTALTTRLLDDSDGRERLRASIGRIHYFNDRQVTLLASDPIETTLASDIFAELELSPTQRLSLGLDLQYDTESERTEQSNSRIRYRADHKHQLILDYRYNEPEQLRQSDLVVFWPLARRWQFLGRWRYDLTNEENLDLVAGVEYESCCWAVRVLGRNHLTSSREVDNSVYLTFEFKGLGSLGAKLEDALGGELLTDE